MRAREGVFLAVLLLVYGPAVLAMSEIWRSVDYYSHGFLVPVVACWAASRLRHKLARAAPSRDARGLLVIFASLALYAWGTLSGIVFASGVATVAAVAGALLYLRGPAWLTILGFPVGFLLFMVPLPDAWVTPVIVQLQLLVSSVAVGALRYGGMAILREGNVIHLPGDETLFVAEACSGITSVITLLPLGVFLAYFTEKTTARRAVLVAAVFPLAMLGNLLRVVGTLIASRYVGAEAASSGPVHDWAGVGTYVIGCLALLGVGALMRLLWPERAAPRAT
ncbi:MAG: exosortase/archaeosortase family protein [Myxococcota bacterium]